MPGMVKVSRTSARPSTFSRKRRLEQALHGVAHVVEGVVDDRVEADVDAFALGGGGRLRLRPDVEADDDGVRGRRQHDVALGDAADRRVQHVEPHLVGRQPRERIGERLDRALHVGLDDDAQLLRVAGLHLAVEVLERHLGGLEQRSPRGAWRAGARRPGGPSPRRPRRRRSCPLRARRRGRGSRPASTDRPRSTLCPLSSIMARTRPAYGPQTNGSPDAASLPAPARWPPGRGRGRASPRRWCRAPACRDWPSARAPRPAGAASRAGAAALRWSSPTPAR